MESKANVSESRPSTADVRIRSLDPLVPPAQLVSTYPLTDAAAATVVSGREQVEKVLAGEDDRLLVVVGPCSIHDLDGAREYASKLAALSHALSEGLLVVMRVYFEKPRTTVGWKGLINDPHLDDSQRRQHLFDGDLLVYHSTPVSKEFCNHAQQLIQEAFGNDPQNAQHTMKVEDFVSVAASLKSKFTNDDKTKKLIQNLLTEYSCDLEKTYFDVPRLRIVTSGGYLSAGVGYTYKAHRDTWYSSPPSQINWWMSVYPLKTEQSLEFYPEYWDTPIKNSSADFDYQEWCQTGRPQALKQISKDTRKHPLPLEEIDTKKGLRVVMSEAQPILFSAGNLHGTVPNSSGFTRFSFDFRTVNKDDLASNNGSPNIDCQSKGTTIDDFILASDFTPLQEI